MEPLSEIEKCQLFSLERNPLLIDVILNSLFRFVKGKDLRSCRLVCLKWKVQSEYNFRKTSKIYFPLSEFKNKRSEEAMANLLDVFPPSEDQIPFSAIKFKGQMEISVLTEFFKSEKGQAIKDLEMSNITAIDSNNECDSNDSEDFDDFEYLDELDISDMIRRNELTKIRVEDCDDQRYDTTKIVVEFSCLKDCQSVSLYNCGVILNATIGPKILSIDRAFLKNSKKEDVEDILINDFVDFTKCEEVDLGCDEDMQLDMSCPTIKLKEVSLDDMDIINWKTAAWTVEELSLSSPLYSYTEKNLLKVKVLEFENWNKVDLAALPITIEKLIFNGTERTYVTKVTNSSTSSLPNLKCLQILHPRKTFDFINLFANCRLLQELELNSLRDNLDVPRLFPSIRRLSLASTNISGDNTKTTQLRPLDTLVVNHGFVSRLTSALDVFQPQILVMRFETNSELTEEVYQRVVEQTKAKTIRQLIMGPISNLVDDATVKPQVKQWIGDAKFCCIEDGVGQAIEERQFKKYFDFCYDDSDD